MRQAEYVTLRVYEAPFGPLTFTVHAPAPGVMASETGLAPVCWPRTVPVGDNSATVMVDAPEKVTFAVTGPLPTVTP